VRNGRKPREEVHNLNSSPNIIRVIQSKKLDGWDMWHVWRRGAYRVLVGKPEGKVAL
jgi:hypothetical protein